MGTVELQTRSGEVLQFEFSGDVPSPKQASAIAKTLQREDGLSQEATDRLRFFLTKMNQVESPEQLEEFIASRQAQVQGLPSQQREERLQGILQNVRNFFPALAGGAGFVAGAGLTGGSVPGGAAGGALAASGAQALQNLVEEGAIQAGIISPAARREGLGAAPSLQAQAGRAVGTGAVDLVSSALGEVPGAVLRPAFQRVVGTARPVVREASTRVGQAVQGALQQIPGLGRLAGRQIEVSPFARELAQEAGEIGVPVGLTQATSRSLIRRAATVIGKIPVIGRPFPRSQEQAAAALGEERRRLLRSVLPWSRTITETGVDLGEAAFQRAKSIREPLKTAFDKAFREADRAGAVILPENTRRTAREVIEEFLRETPTRVVGEGAKARSVPVRRTGQPLIGWIRDNMANLESMTPSQYQGLAKDLGARIEQASKGGNRESVRRLVRLRQALELDLDSIQGAPEAVRNIQRLKNAWFEFMTTLETPTARRFLRADRRIFDVGIERQTGTLESDQLFGVVFREGSPQAMRDLHGLVGNQTFRQALRLHMERAFGEGGIRSAAAETVPGEGILGQSAQARQMLNIARLRSNVMGQPGTPQREAMKAALEKARTGVTIRDLDRFFDVAQRAFPEGVIDVSQFLARRTAIGGFRSIRTLLPTAVASGATSPISISGAVIAGMVFGFADFVTSPAVLRSATRALDTSLPALARRQAAARVLTSLADRGGPESELSNLPEIPSGGDLRNLAQGLNPLGFGASEEGAP